MIKELAAVDVQVQSIYEIKGDYMVNVNEVMVNYEM